MPPTQRLLLQVDREGGRAEEEEEEVAGLATVLRDGLFGTVVSLSWGAGGNCLMVLMLVILVMLPALTVVTSHRSVQVGFLQYIFFSEMVYVYS